MIIECPACNTRYDIKVDLPPEGRTVRCAKCEHIWRATQVVDDLYSTGEAEEPAGDEASGMGDDGQAAAGWGGDEETAAYSRGYGQAEEAEEDQDPFSGGSAFPEREPVSYEEAPEEPGPDVNEGKVRWFGSFLRKSQTPPAPRAQAGFEAQEPLPAAEPIPFPRPGPAIEAQPPADGHVRTLDDARAAVRNVFASLGEQRPNHAASSIHAPVTAYTEPAEDGFPFRSLPETAETDEPNWETGSGDEPGFTQHFTGDRHFSGDQPMDEPADGGAWTQDAAGEEGAGAAASQGWFQNWQPEERPEAPAEGDMDAQLRAALHAHFPSRSAPGEPAQAPQPQFGQEPAGETSEAEISEALTAFWKRPSVTRSQPSAPSAMALEDEDGDSATEIAFDERLYREIEETREHSGPPRFGEQRGALALAASWGLFLCVAGGLTAGLLGFRDIAADALPGLAPFYRALGMPVTVQPLIFEGVQYEWTVSDFKPALHIKGAVYNRAQRSVNAPEFIVSIKDNDPALDKEFPATLPVENGKIPPEERADFELELLSPSPTITAVELALRDVR